MTKKFEVIARGDDNADFLYHVWQEEDDDRRIIAGFDDFRQAEQCRKLLEVTQPVSTIKRTDEQLEHVADMLRLCGQYRDPRDRLIEKMARDHRTIQQLYMAFAVAFIERMAENNHDLRNEAAVEFAKVVMEKVPPEQRTMPYI